MDPSDDLHIILTHVYARHIGFSLVHCGSGTHSAMFSPYGREGKCLLSLLAVRAWFEHTRRTIHEAMCEPSGLIVAL